MGHPVHCLHLPAGTQKGPPNNPSQTEGREPRGFTGSQVRESHCQKSDCKRFLAEGQRVLSRSEGIWRGTKQKACGGKTEQLWDLPCRERRESDGPLAETDEELGVGPILPHPTLPKLIEVVRSWDRYKGLQLVIPRPLLAAEELAQRESWICRILYSKADN